jgi:hypothetical protein
MRPHACNQMQQGRGFCSWGRVPQRAGTYRVGASNQPTKHKQANKSTWRRS